MFLTPRQKDLRLLTVLRTIMTLYSAPHGSASLTYDGQLTFAIWLFLVCFEAISISSKDHKDRRNFRHAENFIEQHMRLSPGSPG